MSEGNAADIRVCMRVYACCEHLGGDVIDVLAVFSSQSRQALDCRLAPFAGRLVAVVVVTVTGP